MKRLKEALEALDAIISGLEDRIEAEQAERQFEAKKSSEALRNARGREATVLAVAQKVATRLDQTIDRVERVLKD